MRRSFDIYTNAGLTEAQFDSYNPGLDCSLLQIGENPPPPSQLSLDSSNGSV